MFAAGIGIPILAALNAQLGARIGSPVAAGVLAIAVALLFAAIAAIATGSLRAHGRPCQGQPVHLLMAGD